MVFLSGMDDSLSRLSLGPSVGPGLCVTVNTPAGLFPLLGQAPAAPPGEAWSPPGRGRWLCPSAGCGFMGPWAAAARPEVSLWVGGSGWPASRGAAGGGWVAPGFPGAVSNACSWKSFGGGVSRRDDWNPGLTSPAGQKGPRYPRGFLLVPEQHPFQGDPSGSSSPPLSRLLLTFSRHFLRLAELPWPGRTDVTAAHLSCSWVPGQC